MLVLWFRLIVVGMKYVVSWVLCKWRWFFKRYGIGPRLVSMLLLRKIRNKYFNCSMFYMIKFVGFRKNKCAIRFHYIYSGYNICPMMGWM
jgi:hypothetical protein